jgi:hypothetical protein
MGRLPDAIDDTLRAFLEAQHLFFVATAPLDADGHVNVSPKGLDTFRIVDAHSVAYLDFVGSGAETIAHLRENGRVCLMFCAFDGPPRIVRLHGRGETVTPDHARFDALRARFPDAPDGSVRAIVVVHVTRVSDSCGYGVPLFRYEGERPQLPAWAARKGPEGLARYQRDKNALSIDGLPALSVRD